jgi:hypothetical protein
VNGFIKTVIFHFEISFFRDYDYAAICTYFGSNLGYQKDHSTLFVMPSDIAPVPDYQRPSTLENTIREFPHVLCLVTGSPHKRKLLQRIEKEYQIVARKTCGRQAITATATDHATESHQYCEQLQYSSNEITTTVSVS